MTGPVALATCSDWPAGDEDGALLLAAFDRAGRPASFQVWDDPDVDWSAFERTLLRSTWDYTLRRAEFLAWAARVPGLTNALDVVAWSSDKTYLRDLHAAGVPVVPTGFGTELPPSGEVVVKPSVGAGSRGAGRFDLPRERAQAQQHVQSLQADGRTVLVQPFLPGVDTDGETAMVMLGGAFSHAARKDSMLPPGTVHPLATPFADNARLLFVQEHIATAHPGPAERDVADLALAYVAARFGPVAYARVDLLPTPDGPVVVELELVEPSLFLDRAADPAAAADRLVAALP